MLILERTFLSKLFISFTRFAASWTKLTRVLEGGTTPPSPPQQRHCQLEVRQSLIFFFHTFLLNPDNKPGLAKQQNFISKLKFFHNFQNVSHIFSQPSIDSHKDCSNIARGWTCDVRDNRKYETVDNSVLYA